MERIQEPPFCVQVELTLGCNLQCTFCGINGFQEKPNKSFDFMTPDTAERIAREIKRLGWTARIEFARRGEPTKNSNWIEIAHIFRFVLGDRHQLMMTSNGSGLMSGPGVVENIWEMFEDGLNIFALDEYEGINFGSKARAAISEHNSNPTGRSGWPEGLQFLEYPRQPDGNPHRRYKRDCRKFVFVEDISAAKSGVHATLNNHAGHGSTLDLTYNKRCAKPFRELSFNWDGSVDICCIDWLSEYRIGNIHDMDLDEIWQSDEFNAARKFLIQGQRNSLRPCLGCNHNFYRPGLLPDPMGKAKLSGPERADIITVQTTNLKGPQIKPSWRAIQNIYPFLPQALRDVWLPLVKEKQGESPRG